MSQRITAVVAADLASAIGKQGGLPWHLPDDLRFFMRYTTGKPVLMGRKTFESIGSKPLKNRLNMVLSSNPIEVEGVVWVSSMEQALQQSQNEAELIVAGGAGIYALAEPFLTEVRMTRVHAKVEGADTFFPIKLDSEQWILQERIAHGTDERHDLAFDFECWVRTKQKETIVNA